MEVSFGKDRISQLPNEILHHILSFLPPRDLVKTSSLSTRWHSLWTFFTTVNLCFDRQISNDNLDLSGHLDILLKTQLHEGRFPHPKCRIRLTGPVDAVSVDLWVDKLGKKLHPLKHSQTLYWMPDDISTFESLTSLKLIMFYCTLIVPDSICLPRLKTLYLYKVTFKDNHSLQRLLSGCSILEDLTIRLCSWTYVSNIITISLPSLQKLTICGSFAPKVFLLNLSSLTEAKLLLNNCKTHSALTLLSGVLGVKSLQLSSQMFEVISCAENFLAHLPTFYNLTHLTVESNCCSCAKLGMVCILQQSPNLQVLQICQALTGNPCNKEDHRKVSIDPLEILEYQDLMELRMKLIS